MVEKCDYGAATHFFTRDGDIAHGAFLGMRFFGNDILAYPNPSLRTRPVKYLAMAATGLCTREIGEIAERSPNTIKTHLVQAYAKLGASNISHATRLLFETEVFVPDVIKKSPAIKFTARQIEVLDVISRGKHYDDAGNVLGLSGLTIKSQLARMAQRNDLLHIGSAGLVMLAFCRGELTPDGVETGLEFDIASEALSQAS